MPEVSDRGDSRAATHAVGRIERRSLAQQAADQLRELILIEQLKPGGRMVIPVGRPFSYQELKLVIKDQDGGIDVRDILGVAFVPFQGERDE